MPKQRGRLWQADITHEGTRHRPRFKTHRAALAWETAARGAIASGRAIPEPIDVTGETTLSAVFDRVCKLRWDRMKSGDKLSATALKFVEHVGAKVDASTAFSQENIDGYVEAMVDQNRASGTINRHLSGISALAKQAKALGFIETMPEMPWQKEGQGRVRFFEEDEEDLILRTLESWDMDDEADLIRFLIDTGARPFAEACRLTWGDVERGRATFWDTKNGSSRSVPLTARAQAAIRALKRRHGDCRGPFAWVNKWTLRTRWARLRTHLPRLADATIYTCRHTTASRLVIRGVDLRRVKDFMGHSAIVTTLRYAHLAPKHLDDCAEALEPLRDCAIR